MKLSVRDWTVFMYMPTAVIGTRSNGRLPNGERNGTLLMLLPCHQTSQSSSTPLGVRRYLFTRHWQDNSQRTKSVSNITTRVDGLLDIATSRMEMNSERTTIARVPKARESLTKYHHFTTLSDERRRFQGIGGAVLS